jgi:ankyrin repeat protein
MASTIPGAEVRQLAVVSALLSAKANVNQASESGICPLHRAISPAIAAMLLDAGADVDALDIERNSPLLKAVQTYNIQLVQLLLKYNADIHIPNFLGITAATAKVCSIDKDRQHDMDEIQKHIQIHRKVLCFVCVCVFFSLCVSARTI